MYGGNADFWDPAHFAQACKQMGAASARFQQFSRGIVASVGGREIDVALQLHQGGVSGLTCAISSNFDLKPQSIDGVRLLDLDDLAAVCRGLPAEAAADLVYCLQPLVANPFLFGFGGVVAHLGPKETWVSPRPKFRLPTEELLLAAMMAAPSLLAAQRQIVVPPSVSSPDNSAPSRPPKRAGRRNGRRGR